MFTTLFAVSEIILSALAGDAAIIDGVDGAMVVATEAAGAAVVVKPIGDGTGRIGGFGRTGGIGKTRTAGAALLCTELDVADGTDLGALATMQAAVGVDGELAVGNHEAVEVGADDVAERPGRQSEGELAVTATAIDDDLDELLQINLCLLYLLTFALWGVCVHKGQANVALGHCERLTALQRDALGRQFLG